MGQQKQSKPASKKAAPKKEKEPAAKRTRSDDKDEQGPAKVDQRRDSESPVLPSMSPEEIDALVEEIYAQKYAEETDSDNVAELTKRMIKRNIESKLAQTKPPVPYEALGDAFSFANPEGHFLEFVTVDGHMRWAEAIAAATALWDDKTGNMRDFPIELGLVTLHKVHRKSIDFDPDRPVFVDAMSYIVPTDACFPEMYGARNLMFVNCEGSPFGKLGPVVDALPQLHTLNVAGCENVRDATPLSKLKELRNLDVSRTSVGSLAFAAKLKKLEVLRATGMKLDELDLTPFASMANLKVLDVNAAVKSLAPLSKLRGLEEVRVFSVAKGKNFLDSISGWRRLRKLHVPYAEPITTLEPLAGLTELVDLQLHDVNCTLAPLESLKKLRVLDLSKCSSEDLSPLESLQDLQELTMEFSEHTEIPSLACLRSLRKLKLPHSSIEDLAPIATLPDLEELDLQGAASIQDFQPLSQLTSLRVLNLSMFEDEPPNLQPLSALINLEHLDLTNCPDLTADDLEALKPLKKLEYLSLSDSECIDDISALCSLTGMKHLDLSMLPGIRDLSPLSSLTDLVTLNLSMCMSVSDLSPIESLKNLVRVDHQGTRVKGRFMPFNLRSMFGGGDPSKLFDIMKSLPRLPRDEDDDDDEEFSEFDEEDEDFFDDEDEEEFFDEEDEELFDEEDGDDEGPASDVFRSMFHRYYSSRGDN